LLLLYDHYFMDKPTSSEDALLVQDDELVAPPPPANTAAAMMSAFDVPDVSAALEAYPHHKVLRRVVQFARDAGALDNSLTLAKLRRHVIDLVESGDEDIGAGASATQDANHSGDSDTLFSAVEAPLPGGTALGGGPNRGEAGTRPLLTYQAFHNVLNAIADLKYGDTAAATEMLVGAGTFPASVMEASDHPRKRLQQLIVDCLLPLSKGLAAALEQIRRSSGRSLVRLSLDHSPTEKGGSDGKDRAEASVSINDLPLPISSNVDLVCVAGILEVLERNEQTVKDLFFTAVANGPTATADLHDCDSTFDAEAGMESTPENSRLSSFQNARVSLKTFVEMWEYFDVSPRLISRKRLLGIFSAASCRAFGDAVNNLFYSSPTARGSTGTVAATRDAGSAFPRHGGEGVDEAADFLFEMRRLSENCPPLTLSQFEECVVLISIQVGPDVEEQRGRQQCAGVGSAGAQVNELPQLLHPSEVAEKLKVLLCEIERGRMNAIFTKCCALRMSCGVPPAASLFDCELCSSMPALDALYSGGKTTGEIDAGGSGVDGESRLDFSVKHEMQCHQLPVYCHERTGGDGYSGSGMQTQLYSTMGLSQFILALRCLRLISNLFGYSQACLLFFHAARRHPYCWQHCRSQREGANMNDTGDAATNGPHALAQNNHYGLDYRSFVYCLGVATEKAACTQTPSDYLQPLPQRPQDLDSFFEDTPSSSVVVGASAGSDVSRQKDDRRMAVLQKLLCLDDHMQKVTNGRGKEPGVGHGEVELPARSDIEAAARLTLDEYEMPGVLLPIVTEPVLLVMQTESVALKCVFEIFSIHKSDLHGDTANDSLCHARVPDDFSSAAFSVTARDPRYHPLAPIGAGAVLAWDHFVELCQHFSILPRLLSFETLAELYLKVCTKHFTPLPSSPDTKIGTSSLDPQQQQAAVAEAYTDIDMQALQDEIDALNARLEPALVSSSSASSSPTTASSDTATETETETTGTRSVTDGGAQSTLDSASQSGTYFTTTSSVHDDDCGDGQRPLRGQQLSTKDCYLTFPQFQDVLLLMAQTAFGEWNPPHSQGSEALSAGARLWRLMMVMDNGKNIFKLRHWPPSSSEKWMNVVKPFHAQPEASRPSVDDEHAGEAATGTSGSGGNSLGHLESDLLCFLTFEQESVMDVAFVYYCGHTYCQCVEGDVEGRVPTAAAGTRSNHDEDHMACSQWLALVRDTGLVGTFQSTPSSVVAGGGDGGCAPAGSGPSTQARGCSWPDLLSIFDIFAEESPVSPRENSFQAHLPLPRAGTGKRATAEGRGRGGSGSSGDTVLSSSGFLKAYVAACVLAMGSDGTRGLRKDPAGEILASLHAAVQARAPQCAEFIADILKGNLGRFVAVLTGTGNRQVANRTIWNRELVGKVDTCHGTLFRAFAHPPNQSSEHRSGPIPPPSEGEPLYASQALRVLEEKGVIPQLIHRDQAIACLLLSLNPVHSWDHLLGKQERGGTNGATAKVVHCLPPPLVEMAQEMSRAPHYAAHRRDGDGGWHQTPTHYAGEVQILYGCFVEFICRCAILMFEVYVYTFMCVCIYIYI
jgi:hypothetical protein